MAERAIGIIARIVFFVCGLVSLFTAVPYALLRGADLPFQWEWVIFVLALAITGLSGMVFAVLPRSRLARLCKTAREDERVFSTPLKLAACLAAISYLVAMLAYLAPHRWNLNPQLMLALCPMYLVRMTFDPSPAAIFCLLAPMNAAVFVSVGLTLRYTWRALRGNS